MKMNKTYVSDVNPQPINKMSIVCMTINSLAVVALTISPIKNQIFQSILMFVNAFCIGFDVGYYLLKKFK
jgi:hypothetical protein